MAQINLRHILLLLTVFTLIIWLPTGCGESQTGKEFRQLREGLTKLQQTKLSQLEQLSEELSNLQVEMSKIESELAQPLPMKALHNLTAEEITKSIRRPGLETKLAGLKKQEQGLIVKKQSLEQEIEEIKMLLGNK